MFIFLIIVTAYVLVVAMLAIGVVGAHPGVIRPMVRAPRHLVRLLLSRQMRRNHALEHATINLLRRRHARITLFGMPDQHGFHLRGRVPHDAVIRATQEGIRRLKQGERSLAWSRRCPTSLVATQVILSVIFLVIVLSIWREFIAPVLLTALMAGALLGPPVSPYVQRWLLVEPDPGSLEFRDLEIEEPTGRLRILSFLLTSPMFVRTASGSGSGRAEEGDVTLITSDQQELAAGSYRVRE